MERTLVYFVSDVHLGLDHKDPGDRERRFVSFLKAIPAHKTRSLYLLGDIWDFWYEYRDVVPKGYCRVFSAIQDLIEEGVEVFFFPGNHDIWCYSYFAELGMKILRQPYFVEIGGKSFCLGHGDGLGKVGWSYNFLKAIFNCRFLQVLFSTIHPWFAFRLGNSWSHSNRLSKDLHYNFKGESEPLYRYALEASSSRKVDFFIFGHYHCKVDMMLPTGARLMIMPDWMDSSDYLYFDGISTFFGHLANNE